MSVEFSAKISLLRKEKNISQRQASEDLGISQALLSHYEKGIRECNLDFVKKAASYYGVTSDYLLGITESRKGITDLYSSDIIEEDEQISQKTVIRAMIYLSQLSSVYGEIASDFFCEYFSVAIKKYVSLLSNEPANSVTLSDLCMQMLANEKREDRKRFQDFSDMPEALKTVELCAGDIIKERIKSVI
ncbi:MAG: helix-turn-helix transcriptional regulator [Oscillospiraceae bacterium]|nr:helix-turn-helix transcriptional regulator [Oscillospiraceae bacterium]